MKIKCPFCEQSYDLSDKEIVSFGTSKLECANCGKSFTLREVIPAFAAYLKIAKLQSQIEDEKQELVAEKENLKSARKKAKQDGVDEYDWRYDEGGELDLEANIEATKCDIQFLKNDLVEAKEDYKLAKGSYMKEAEARRFYVNSMFDLFEKGFLIAPLSEGDKQRVLNCIMLGNCEEVAQELILNKAFHYCLIDELVEVSGRLIKDKYFPIRQHYTDGDGTITPKQHALLVKFGLDSTQMMRLGKQDASALISHILNEDGITRNEWIKAFADCKDKAQLIMEINKFNTARVIVPPPKETP